MISFRPLREKIKREGITYYWLMKRGVNSLTVQKIKRDQIITTKTLNELCEILHCPVSDIIEFIDDSD